MSSAIDVTIIRNTKNMMTALALSRNEKEHRKRAYVKHVAGFFEKSLLKYLHFNTFISFEVFKKCNFYNETKDRMFLIL